MEQAETPIESTQFREPVRSPESLKGKRFSYAVVFGQGPVQEKNISTLGREGLNFYSRLLALSAAQMLKDGVIDKVILTGGATGARAGMPETQTEADLMADIIRRRLTTTSEDGKAYISNGRRIEINNSDGSIKPRADIDKEIEEAFSDKLLIENEAQDTLQNFSFIVNKYLDVANKDDSIALLGISFHAKDTYSGAGIGRLALLADIFGINAETYSAEEILNEAIIKGDDYGGFVRNTLARLTNLATSHRVSQLKSAQEKLLVEGLRAGEWVKALPFLKNPARATQMIISSSYIVAQLAVQLGINEKGVRSMDTDQLLLALQKIKLGGTPQEYASVKAAVFSELANMKDEKGTDYLATYGKGKIPES